MLLHTYIVNEVKSPIRLVDYAIGLFEPLPTKSSVKKAIKNKTLRIRNVEATTGTFIENEMVLELYEPSGKQPKPYHEELPIVYEDNYLAVINKPGGLATSGNQFRTLQNILINVIPLPPTSEYLGWPRPVHRLDAATCGLVLVAKTIKALVRLGQAFEQREIQKTYHALVMGKTPRCGEWDDPIGRHPAHTTFEKVSEVKSLKNDYLTLLKLQPATGRTHQLRIHCSQAGFPIYGDQLYASNTIKNKGLFLAATEIALIHPITSRPLNISMALPKKFLSRMKNEQRRWEKYHSS